MSDQQLISSVEEIVNSLKELLNVEADVKCEVADEDGEKVININFEGEKLGYMIGNQGRHLDALQYILSMIINKKFAPDRESRLFVNIDVSGYKREKEERIESMALRAADDARILGDPVDMDPMPPAERRVVHMILSKFDDIKTESFGEGDERAVRITPISESSLGVDSFNSSSDEEGEEAEE